MLNLAGFFFLNVSWGKSAEFTQSSELIGVPFFLLLSPLSIHHQVVEEAASVLRPPQLVAQMFAGVL